jgi:3D (Asp-Asp-Asp) domain-containing protein
MADIKWSAFTNVGAPQNGDVVVGLRAGANVQFTSVGTGWSGIAGTSQAAAVGNGYVVQNAGQTTITLPAVAPLGSIVSIRGLGAAGWILAANAGQTIHMGNQATSVAGSLTSTNQYDSVDVTCTVANTTWSVNAVQSGGLTIA